MDGSVSMKHIRVSLSQVLIRDQKMSWSEDSKHPRNDVRLLKDLSNTGFILSFLKKLLGKLDTGGSDKLKSIRLRM